MSRPRKPLLDQLLVIYGSMSVEERRLVYAALRGFDAATSVTVSVAPLTYERLDLTNAEHAFGDHEQ